MISSDHRSVDRKKRYIRRLVLRSLWRQGSMTRHQIAAVAALSLPSVSDLLHELKAARLLTLTRGMGETDRRRVYIHVNPDYLQALGIHITRRGISVAIVDVNGKIRGKSWSNTFRPAEGSVGLLRLITRTLVSAGQHIQLKNLRGAGIAIAGTVRDQAISENFPIFRDWVDINLAEIAKRATGLPTYVANDAFAETFAESQYGCARGVKNALFLHYGWGLQLGLILDSEIRRGGGYAGEIGHIPAAEGGPVCTCGNLGCLESVSSVGAIVKGVIQAIQQGTQSEVLSLAGGNLEKVSWEMVLQAAERGDPLASNMLERALDYLASALAGSVHLLHPELLILGGLMRSQPPLLAEALKRKVSTRVVPLVRRHLRIEVSALGPEAGVIGAGALVFNQMFG